MSWRPEAAWGYSPKKIKLPYSLNMNIWEIDPNVKVCLILQWFCVLCSGAHNVVFFFKIKGPHEKVTLEIFQWGMCNCNRYVTNRIGSFIQAHAQTNAKTRACLVSNTNGTTCPPLVASQKSSHVPRALMTSSCVQRMTHIRVHTSHSCTSSDILYKASGYVTFRATGRTTYVWFI